MPAGTAITGIGALFYLMLSLIGVIFRFDKKSNRKTRAMKYLLPGILLLVFSIVSTSIIFGFFLINHTIVFTFAESLKLIVHMIYVIEVSFC